VFGGTDRKSYFDCLYFYDFLAGMRWGEMKRYKVRRIRGKEE
jgi:hypothetical protein